MTSPSQARRQTVAEVERLIRWAAVRDWSHPNPWGLFSIACAIAGYGALLLWHAELGKPGDVGLFIALAGGSYFYSLRTCLPSPGTLVDYRVVDAISRSPKLPPTLKQACAEAFYRGGFTYMQLLYLAHAPSTCVQHRR